MNNNAPTPSSANPGLVENDLVHGALQAASERTSLHLSALDLAAGPRGGNRIHDDTRLTLDLNGVAQSYRVVARTRLRGRDELDAIARQNHHAEVPVLLAPKRCVTRIPAAERHESAIALGPAPAGSVLAGAGVAHV